MSNSAGSVAAVGCTGLVGSQILLALQALPTQPIVHAIARRAIPSAPSNTQSVVEPDSSQWPQRLQSLKPVPNVFFSALGTTRAIAGSFEAQRKIDYDLNLALARAAKDAGVETYVLISSAGTSATSVMPYSKMKGELDEAVKALGFPYTVIVRPGLLVGNRQDVRPPEAILRYVAKGMRMVSQKWLTDWWAQDVDVIGRATVSAALQCMKGKREKGIWVVEQSEIVRLGKEEANH